MPQVALPDGCCHDPSNEDECCNDEISSPIDGNQIPFRSFYTLVMLKLPES